MRSITGLCTRTGGPAQLNYSYDFMKLGSASVWLGAFAAGVLLPCGVIGQVFELYAGNHVLLPDTPGQSVTLTVANVNGAPHAVSGVNVYVDIGDGHEGPIPAPTIQAFNLSVGPLNGFITIAPGTPNPALPSKSLQTSATVNTPPGTVSFPVGGPYDFMHLTIDTTGFFSGTWDLKVAGINGGSFEVEFLNVGFPQVIATTHFNGTISIVPEPSTYAALSGLALLAFAGYRRFRR